MASGADTQTHTHRHTHTQTHTHTHTLMHTHIPTLEPKQFKETRHAQPLAMCAWFKYLQQNTKG